MEREVKTSIKGCSARPASRQRRMAGLVRRPLLERQISMSEERGKREGREAKRSKAAMRWSMEGWGGVESALYTSGALPRVLCGCRRAREVEGDENWAREGGSRGRAGRAGGGREGVQEISAGVASASQCKRRAVSEEVQGNLRPLLRFELLTLPQRHRKLKN